MLVIRDGYWQKSESAFQFLNIGTHIHVWVLILYGCPLYCMVHTPQPFLSCFHALDRLFLLLDTPVMFRMMVLDVVNKPPIFVQDGTFTLGL